MSNEPAGCLGSAGLLLSGLPWLRAAGWENRLDQSRAKPFQCAPEPLGVALIAGGVLEKPLGPEQVKAVPVRARAAGRRPCTIRPAKLRHRILRAGNHLSFVLGGVSVQRNPDLAHVVAALNGLGLFTGLAQRRQEDRDQKRD